MESCPRLLDALPMSNGKTRARELASQIQQKLMSIDYIPRVSESMEQLQARVLEEGLSFMESVINTACREALDEAVKTIFGDISHRLLEKFGSPMLRHDKEMSEKIVRLKSRYADGKEVGQ